MPSLLPRPPLTTFFIAEEKKFFFFFHCCEKSCEGRPGYEASVSLLLLYYNAMEPMELHVHNHV